MRLPRIVGVVALAWTVFALGFEALKGADGIFYPDRGMDWLELSSRLTCLLGALLLVANCIPGRFLVLAGALGQLTWFILHVASYDSKDLFIFFVFTAPVPLTIIGVNLFLIVASLMIGRGQKPVSPSTDPE